MLFRPLRRAIVPSPGVPADNPWVGAPSAPARPLPPFRMRPRVHLGAEVDRRAEGRLTEDDRMLSEEDQLPGSGGRHRRRFPPTRLNLSGSADFRTRREPGRHAAVERRGSGLRRGVFLGGLAMPLLE